MRQVFCVALSVTLLFIVGCANRRVVTDPSFQPQIINQPDSFSFQATNVTNITQTIQYTWQNSDTLANVNLSSQIASGSGTITILNPAGLQVFTSSMTANGTFTTGAGTAGAWTIRVVLNNVSGTLNFRVQRT